MRTHYAELTIDTTRSFEIVNVTERLREVVAQSGIGEGMAMVQALHTTVALTVNEDEERLRRDVENWFLSIAPPHARWLHNDIHLRDCPPDEPENAHAHIIQMLLGQAQTLIVHAGAPVLGRWQSVLMVELDGPRTRRLAVQVLGA
jgi:secondary thiamine-phosphate synthase enzyme